MQWLGELNWAEGRSIKVEYRSAEGVLERAGEIAVEFVRLNVDVIVTAGDAQVLAAKWATEVIPIVIAAAGDPIGNGLVASLARPGGNVTALSLQLTDTAGKRFELLREIVPGLRRLAIKAIFEIFRGDAAAAQRSTETLVELSRAHGLSLYLTYGAVFLGWARARLGDRETGVTELRAALAAYTDQGNKLYVPFYQGLLAEIEMEGEGADVALSRIDEALALGVPELLPQLGFYLAGRRGVGGRGAARSAYMHER